MAQSENKPPRVAISYSHKPDEHAERILEIAQRLASDGVDESNAFYKELAVIWKDLPPEDFRQKFNEGLTTSSAQNFGFARVRGDWGNWMNLNKLGTRE